MDALNIVAIPNFTTSELYVESNTMQCAGILDAPPSYEMARRSFDLLKKLEGWGFISPKMKRKLRTLQYHPIGNFLTAMEEPDLKVIIARKAEEKGSLTLNRTMGLELLMDGGSKSGPIGKGTAWMLGTWNTKSVA